MLTAAHLQLRSSTSVDAGSKETFAGSQKQSPSDPLRSHMAVSFVDLKIGALRFAVGNSHIDEA